MENLPYFRFLMLQNLYQLSDHREITTFTPMPIPQTYRKLRKKLGRIFWKDELDYATLYRLT